ncbi:MAG: NAD(P)/FAD-dependent oxidoreductase [Chromatiaceae bacterium]|jgi:sulfide dehydrogenase [flavocytochrome c] flavoprotein subunit|nr:NAD(P)/FAD-dependent oxidoreductase [Chromatiaceae bacterium]
MNTINRRKFIQALAAAPLASVLTVPTSALAAKKKAKQVVVVGGGFAGATAAKYVQMLDPSIKVTLIEPLKTYTSCPLSNEVVTHHRTIESLQIGYEGLTKRGVEVLHDTVTAIDPAKKSVKTQGGKTLGYDAVVVAPGVEFDFTGVEGYSQEVSEKIPHAYKGAEQTLLLRQQLEGLPDGGVFVIVVPKAPIRCPPGPYERAAQVAYYCLNHGKPKSKVLILDSNDSFAKKALFEQSWEKLYPGMIEWVAGSAGGTVERIDAESRTAATAFDEHKADVLNFIPRHTAGGIAKAAGLTNEAGWCDVVPLTMESAVHKGVYVVGDACKGGTPEFPMPKSAHMGMTQAKVAAGAIVASLNGLAPPVPYYANTCYSLAAPDYGFSVVQVYRVDDNQFVYVKEAGGVSPVDAPAIQRKLEAQYADGWFHNVMADAFT